MKAVDETSPVNRCRVNRGDALRDVISLKISNRFYCKSVFLLRWWFTGRANNPYIVPRIVSIFREIREHPRCRGKRNTDLALRI